MLLFGRRRPKKLVLVLVVVLVLDRLAWKVALDVGRVDGIIREEPKDALRQPLSGRISATPDPGCRVEI